MLKVRGCETGNRSPKEPRICIGNGKDKITQCCVGHTSEIEEDSHTLECLVADFVREFGGKRENSELAEFKEETLHNAIKRAGQATWRSGKRFAHQRRLKKSDLDNATNALLNPSVKRLIEKASDFQSLHELIHTKIGCIPSVGELMVYDTALRIGAFLNIYPEKVYLHNGTREGAKALGLAYWQNFLEVIDFPSPVRKLKPFEIEDFLCIYKAELKVLNLVV